MKGRYRPIGLSLFIAAILAGAYFYIQPSFSKENEITEVAEKIKERAQEPLGKEAEATSEQGSQATRSPDMEEVQVQIYLHHMTHQKVEASKKWGAVEMTPQNIENLLVIVKANADLYERSDYYQTVLEEWLAGDFSNAVSVHNFIWDLHGGTVGRATGLLNEQEEKIYIEKNF